MIKILKEELDQTLGFLKKIEACPNSHNCLWLQRSILFQISGSLPKGCLREKCPIVFFRKKFESESPALYAEALGLSRFHFIVETSVKIAQKINFTERKLSKSVDRWTCDLHAFGQLVALIAYPFSLGAKKIPFLGPTEIAELKRNYRKTEINQTVKKMHKLNAEWVGSLDSLLGGLLSPHSPYPWNTLFLAHLFLKGLEKDQLPDLNAMSQEEKNMFFSEIVQGIFQERETG